MQQGIVLLHKCKPEVGFYWRVMVLPVSFDPEQFNHLVSKAQIYRAMWTSALLSLYNLCYVLCDLSSKALHMMTWCDIAYEDDDMA